MGAENRRASYERAGRPGRRLIARGRRLESPNAADLTARRVALPIASTCVCIAVAALGGSQLGRNSFHGLLVLTMLAHAVRLYVRHAIYADVAHAKGHELKVGNCAPHISSLEITYRACEVLNSARGAVDTRWLFALHRRICLARPAHLAGRVDSHRHAPRWSSVSGPSSARWSA